MSYERKDNVVEGTLLLPTLFPLEEQMKHLIIAVIFIGALFMVHIALEFQKITALQEIAYNTDEIRISLDNITNLKDEVMIDLQEHLPDWAWR